MELLPQLAHVQAVEDDGERHDRGRRPLPTKRRRRSGQSVEFLDHVGEYFACPNGHELPDDFLTAPYYSIGLVGPMLSMKSHWIAITANALLEGGALRTLNRRQRWTWTATAPSERVLADEYSSIIRDHHVLDRTAPERQSTSLMRSPITLQVDIENDDPLARRPLQRAYVLLFDAPGEKLEGTELERKAYARYIAAADALIFFLDVLQVPQLRDKLTVPVPDDYRNRSPRTQVVNSCAKWVRQFHGTSAWDPAKCAAVLVVSKADLLEHLADPIVGPRNELANIAGGHRTSSRAERERVAKAIVRLAVPGLREKLESGFRDVRYHLASATGVQPSASGDISELTPWGCVDVLRSALIAAGAAT